VSVTQVRGARRDPDGNRGRRHSEQWNRWIGPDEPLCWTSLPGRMLQRRSLLSEVIATLSVPEAKAARMGLCQAASYQDPKLPWRDHFYYD